LPVKTLSFKIKQKIVNILLLVVMI